MLPAEDEELLEQGGGDGVVEQPFEENDGCQKTENRLMLLVTRRECACVRECLQECVCGVLSLS